MADRDNPKMKKGLPKRKYEMNFDPEVWKRKFLYPFALDPAPLRLDASKQTP